MSTNAKKLILVGIIVIIVAIILSVVFSFSQSTLSTKPYNVGSSAQYLGRTSGGDTIFIDNKKLFYIDKTNQFNVIDNQVVEARLSQNGNGIIYFIGFGNNAQIHIYSMIDHSNKKFERFYNGFWFHDDAYLLKSTDKGYQVYKNGSDATNITLHSDDIHQLGENIFISKNSDDPDSSSLSYHIFNPDFSDTGKIVQIDPPAEIRWGRDYAFYTDDNNQIISIDQNGNKKTIGNNIASSNLISADQQGKLVYLSYSKANDKNIIEVNSYDLSNAQTHLIEKIDATKLTKTNNTTNQKALNIKAVILNQDNIIIATDDDYWLIDGVKL